VSVIPTLFGESVNIRLLGSRTISLEELGLDEKEYQLILQLIRKPHGIILVTGPTGCGKTTTLYAALSKINSVDKKIITIEDPIEYQLAGVNQMQVQPKIGLTFAEGLRSILRQDPDVIMVGEIRDYETAEIAIRAALTGHLVFSTLHTNDAPSGVTRLLDMGVEPYLVSSSVEAIIAQRLVRVICPNCRTSYRISAESLRELGFPAEEDLTLQRGEGCDECRNTGYKGRTAIFEILLMTEPIKELVLNRASASRIRERAVAEGMKTLVDAGWEKVKAGITTIEEVLRVAEAQEGLS